MTDWFDLPIPWTDMTLRLVIALVCGGIVGFDREYRGQQAGLRTHMLIALGSAAFALIGVCVHLELLRQVPPVSGQAIGDPLRVAAGVVTGIGFLGAGAILQHKGRVRGLTTAAGIWTVSAIGVACGVGLYLPAIVVTVLAFLTLTALRWIEPLMRRGGEEPQDSNDANSNDTESSL